MVRIKIPIDTVLVIFPEGHNIGNLPRKKKKQMKKTFSKVFTEKFYEWLKNNKLINERYYV